MIYLDLALLALLALSLLSILCLAIILLRLLVLSKNMRNDLILGSGPEVRVTMEDFHIFPRTRAKSREKLTEPYTTEDAALESEEIDARAAELERMSRPEHG